MKIKNLLFVLLLSLFSITNIQANVFASAVEIVYEGSFPATIYYTLNQNATSVVISIKNSAGEVVKTINIAGGENGALVGYNDVEWDGSLDAGGTVTGGVYTVEIKAIDDVGAPGYQCISYETGPDSWFWSSSGVAANKRQASPFFGMNYVTERSGGRSSNDDSGDTPRGVYLFDSYGRYLYESFSSAFATGNTAVDWNAINGYAPWGVTVGPDDRVYTFTIPKNHSTEKVGGIAVGDAFFSKESVEIILPFTGDGVSDVLVRGLGAERTLYAVEQPAAGGSDHDGPGDGFDYAHIVKYKLGESTGEFTGTKEEVIPTSTLAYPFRIDMDSKGFLYVVQQVYDSLARAENAYALSKWDISGASPTEIWHIGINDAPEHRDSTINADSARATNFAGLALDEANGIVYTSRRKNARPFHNIMIYDMETGKLLNSFSCAQSVVDTGIVNLPGGGGNNVRDINVDAAGNLLVVNSSTESFRVFTPAGANSYTTVIPSKIDVDHGTVAVEEKISDLPQEYALEQNYPNPFNPTTTINFSLPESGFVTLKVYNILGQEVAQLINEVKTAGTYKVSFDASGLTTGLYIYKIHAGNNFTATKKMMLVK